MALISELSGVKIEYCPVSAEGLMDVKSDDVEILTGRKPMTARELAKNYSYIWTEHVTNWKDIR